MKPLTKCAVILMLAASVLRAQDADTELFQQILGNEQQLLNAIALGDTTTWLKFLHEECLIAVEDGRMLPHAEFISSLKPLPSGYDGHIEIIQPVIRRHENTIVVSFIDDEFLSLFGQNIHTQYRQTDTWKNQDGKWRIIALQLFEIPKNPQPVIVPESVLTGYAGTYALSSDRECVITVEDGKLFAQKTGRPRDELFAETENVFFRKEDARVRVLFLNDPATGLSMVERRAGEDVVWRRRGK